MLSIETKVVGQKKHFIPQKDACDGKNSYDTKFRYH